jgi:hypothetical protein
VSDEFKKYYSNYINWWAHNILYSRDYSIMPLILLMFLFAIVSLCARLGPCSWSLRLFTFYVLPLMARYCSAEIEHSTHNPKAEGLNLPLEPIEKMVKVQTCISLSKNKSLFKFIFCWVQNILYSRNHSIMPLFIMMLLFVIVSLCARHGLCTRSLRPFNF